MPDGKHALVTHVLSNFQMVPSHVDTGWINVNVVSIIDIQKRKVISTIGMDEYDLGAGNPWDVVSTADGELVCVSLAGTHELCFIDSSRLFSDLARKTMQPMMVRGPSTPLWRRACGGGSSCRGKALAGWRSPERRSMSPSTSAIRWLRSI